jgi:hypothetical protein
VISVASLLLRISCVLKKTDWQVRDFHRGFDFLWFNPQVRNIFLVNVTVFCLISEYVQAAFFKLTVAADRKYLLD